jgi:sulfatase maturation enzyme AslB (radical SAM superfamily)
MTAHGKIKATRILSMLRHKRLPGQLVIQLTDRCNARCPQCGMRVTEPFDRSSLSVERIKPMLRAAAEKGFAAVSFTGGEPLLRLKELTTLISYAGAQGIPCIRTGTNGFIFQYSQSPEFSSRIARVADALAETPLRNFWISIDSFIPEVHEGMRGFKGIIRGLEKALPIFHARGLYPSANLGINRNLGGHLTRELSRTQFHCEAAYLAEFYTRYLNAFHRYYRFILSLGFTIVSACYPMSLGNSETDSGLSPVYAATAVDDIVRFTNYEKALLFKALGETVQAFRADIRIFTPLCSLDMLENQCGDLFGNTYSCRGGIDFFFVNASQGDTFPCGYRGMENLGKFQQLNQTAINTSASCTACDWECFRDPSTLSGPFLNGLFAPVRELKKWVKSPRFYRHWLQDLLYYGACDFFNGRMPPRPERLRVFKQGKRT